MKSRASFDPWRKLIVLGIFIALAIAPQLRAQVDTGSVLGTIKDQSGAVIPGATVTLTNPSTGYKVTKTTGPDGSYVFTPIKIGTYDVRAEKTGFQAVNHLNVVVNIQQQVLVDLTLTPGEVTQTVSVTAALPLLQTQNASVQQVVTSKIINDLPLNGRNASFLAQLAAGVSFNHDAGRGLTQSGSFSANGAHSLQNNYMIDGMDNNSEIGDLINRTQFVVMPPPDALDEFTVQTNNYNAEFGHSAGAVLNATTKSGTNQYHGDAWEYVRNDRLDATDFFLNAAGAQKAEYRQNQFGGTLGGPVVIPHVYNGHDKTFFFGYYEGLRIRQGSTGVNSVPTEAERNSGYTNFQDLIAGQSGTRKDLLGRTFPLGTIMDPATSRAVTTGKVDPVTGLAATATGFVRDPFYLGSLTGVKDFTSPAAEKLLNILPANRLDPKAIKLLNLFPTPTSSSLFSNYTSAPLNVDNNDQYGIRIDQDFSARDTMFARYLASDTTNVFPGPFPGLADGQPNRPGSGFTTAKNWGLSETHIFSASLVNEARIGYSRLHDFRIQYEGNNLSNIPAQYGIQGIPQVTENGGLPRINIGSLGLMGTAEFLPDDKWSNTIQATDNLTKIAGRHTLKAGVEAQNIRYPMFGPAYPRGEFDYNGVYTSVVNQTDGSTGRTQFLLTPIAATVPGGINNVGGMSELQGTNIAPWADLGRNYFGLYGQDSWRFNPKLTLDIGVRWDYFTKATEHFDAMANFIPGANFQGGTFLFPASRASEVPQAFINQLALDNIKFTTTNGAVWGKSPANDFGPRFGFAYHPLTNLVVRGGYAIFYGGFETFGLSAYGNGNFPFQVKSTYQNPNAVTPITPNNSIGLLENGLVNVPLTAATATGLSGIILEGEQYNWEDAGTQNYNFFVEYEIAKRTSFKAGYVGSQSRHLMFETGANTIATILPPNTNVRQHLFYPDLGQGGTLNLAWGNSNYNGFQVDLEHRSGNFYTLADFTWAKCLADTPENLGGGGTAGQAPFLAGYGPQYSLCVDGGAARIFHFSGVYNLPFGYGRRFLDKRGVVNALLGGWSANWIFTAQDGEPFNIGCNITTTAGLGCNALLVPGQNPYAGQQLPGRFLNASAFANPPVATTIGQSDYAPLGGMGMQVTGPAYRDVDFSLFKNFRTSERTQLQFRAEFFNLSNTPSFDNPSFVNFSNTKNFGQITDALSSPREIQLALKFLF